jgi:transcriptional regulator with XRE-family HTH domain
MPEALLSSVGVMSRSLHSANRNTSVNVCTGANAFASGVAHTANMPNYLKAWREFRSLSQDELAAKVDTTKSVISLWENDKRSLSDKVLRRLAEALETQPGHLLDVDPSDLDNDIVDIWTRLSKNDRRQAADILRTFLKTGTDSR